MLPQGDYTRADYQLLEASNGEIFKRLVRRYIYPIYNVINNIFLTRRYATDDFKPDLWLWGQRGNDYERHRRRVARYMPLQGRDVLVAGCGTARDIESWIRLKPRRVVGIDWFSYARAWGLWQQRIYKSHPRWRCILLKQTWRT